MLDLKNVEAIFKASPFPCLVLRTDAPRYTIALVNEAYCKITGTTESEIIGKGVFDAFSKETDDLKAADLENLKFSCEKVIATKASCRMAVQKYNIPVRGSSGYTEKYWELMNSPVLNEQGEVEFIILNLTNAINQALAGKKEKSIQNLLLKNGNHYRSLFEHHPDAIYSFDLAGNFLSANQGTARLAECSIDEILKITFLPLIAPEDLERVLGHFNKASAGEIQNYNTGLVTAKGNRLMLDVTNLPIIVNEEIIGVYGIAKNITQRIKAEQEVVAEKEKFRSVIQTVDGIFWEADAQTLVFTFVSQQAEQILGYSPQKWMGEPNFWQNHIHDEDRDEAINFCHVKTVAGKDHRFEYRMITADGNTIWLQDIVSVIKKNGKPHLLRGLMVDITKQKQTEHHLKLLESVIINTNDAVLITEAEPFDEPGPRILYVNEAFTKMTGYLPEEVIGKSPRILQGPKSDRHELKRLGESIRKWEPCEITTINYKKNGDEFWVNFSISPVADANGWYTHWISIERDVTESKKIEQKIQEERNLLRTLIDNLPDSIYFKDASAKKLISNKVDYKLLGAITEEEVLGKTDQEILQNELTISGFHQDMELLKTGKPLVNFEEHFTRENGSSSWFLTNKIPVRNDKYEIVGLLGIGKDITERKQHETQLELSEKRFKALVQEGSDLISILDENRQYKYISPAYTTILGISLEEMVSFSALERVHKDDKEDVLRTLTRLQTEKRVQFLPSRYWVSDNKYCWIESVATNLLDDPAVEGILFNSKDVTERINYIKAIEEQNNKLKDIAWMQSHIVRTPLSRIMGLVDLMKNYSLPEAEHFELLVHLSTSANELDQIIRKIVKNTEMVRIQPPQDE